MTKVQKGSVVEWIEHHTTKKRGAVRLDKRTMTFWARAKEDDPNSQVFESKDGYEVKNWLREQVLSKTDDFDKLEWVPVIEIDRSNDRIGYYRDETQKHAASMQIEINRYYIALTKDGTEWRSLNWEQCDEDSSTFVEQNDRYALSKEFRKGPKAKVDRWGAKPSTFKLPSFSERHSGTETIIEYAEEIWDGLLTLVKQIEQAGKELDKIVGTKKGIAKLIEIGSGKGQLLLGSGK